MPGSGSGSESRNGMQHLTDIWTMKSMRCEKYAIPAFFFLTNFYAVHNFATMKIRNKEIFDLHADLCKTLSSPKRLMIIALLAKKELSVGELAEVLEVPIANVSQHLRTLKDNFVVKARKNGQIVYYSLVDPRMVEACNILRSVLLEKMKARGKVARNINPEELIDE